MHHWTPAILALTGCLQPLPERFGDPCETTRDCGDPVLVCVDESYNMNDFTDLDRFEEEYLYTCQIACSDHEDTCLTYRAPEGKDPNCKWCLEEGDLGMCAFAQCK